MCLLMGEPILYAKDEGRAKLVVPARYSMSSREFVPVWGLRFGDGAGAPHATWIDRSAQRRVDPRQMLRELRGQDESYRPVPDAGEP